MGGKSFHFSLYTFLCHLSFFQVSVLPFQKRRKFGGLILFCFFKAAVGKRRCKEERDRHLGKEVHDSSGFDGPVWWAVNGDPTREIRKLLIAFSEKPAPYYTNGLFALMAPRSYQAPPKTLNKEKIVQTPCSPSQ